MNAALASSAARLRRQAGQHPVDGAQPGRVSGRVDQERQPVIPRPGAQAGRAHLRLQLQVGRVPVMPVGDERPAAGQVGGDRGLLARVAQTPQPVGDAVLGGDRNQRRPLVRDRVHDLGGRGHGGRIGGVGELPAVVDEEDRLQVRLRGRHQLAPPGDQARHDVLVREDARDFRRAEADQADDAALEQGRARSGQALLVDVQRGHPVPDEHARRQPLAQQARRGLLASAARRGARVRVLPWQDKTDDVVRVRRPQLIENAAVYHVVRW